MKIFRELSTYDEYTKGEKHAILNKMISILKFGDRSFVCTSYNNAINGADAGPMNLHFPELFAMIMNTGKQLNARVRSKYNFKYGNAWPTNNDINQSVGLQKLDDILTSRDEREFRIGQIMNLNQQFRPSCPTSQIENKY